LPAVFEIFGAIMPHGVSSGKAREKADSPVFSAKRNDPRRWVERSETHQSLPEPRWISLRSTHPP
jgi:hypothetical protein